MIVYQCLRCGLLFKTKKQVIAHLHNIEKINNDFILDVYYQSFNIKPTPKQEAEIL
ncbi:hypothetical protein [Acidianus ambivalens]|uniref:hypothetical protein n=1 Tax=Acidianus ambivalens TaxID=2283 RepID=UPI001478B311|nr:hypothetical protein [Acidianus ambivalens]